MPLGYVRITLEGSQLNFMHPGSGFGISLERMKRQLKKVVFKTAKKEKVFAFIDAQNIAKGIENSGWKIDWGAFRQWLAKHYNVSQAYMYIGYMAENRDLYLQLNNNGFNIDLKQTVKSNREGLMREHGDIKGNVDVDLTIGVWREYDNYNKAILISGDGDFTSLIEHLIERKKLQKIIVPEFYSSLFKKFSHHIIELNDYRQELNYVRNQEKRMAARAARSAQAAKQVARDKTSVASAEDNQKVADRRQTRQDIKRNMHIFNKK